MKRFFSISMIIIGIVFNCVGCGNHTTKPDTMTEADFGVEKIEGSIKILMGMSRSEVEEQLGWGTEVKNDILPSAISYEHGLTVYYRKNNLADGTEYIQEKQPIICIELSAKAQEYYQTIRKISIDSSREDVLKLYGEKYKIGSPKIDTDIYYNYDLSEKKFLKSGEEISGSEQEKAQIMGINFIFDYDTLNVNTIRIWDNIFLSELK